MAEGSSAEDDWSEGSVMEVWAEDRSAIAGV